MAGEKILAPPSGEQQTDIIALIGKCSKRRSCSVTYLGPRMRVRALFQFLLALDSGLSWMGGALPSSFRLRATATEKMVTLDRRSSSNSSLLKKTNEKKKKIKFGRP